MSTSPFLGCRYCGKALTQVEDGFECQTPGCGKGSIKSPTPGAQTVVVEDEFGNISITTTGPGKPDKDDSDA